MSIEKAENEYLKYLQKKNKESRKTNKAEVEAGPITVIANPPVDSEAEVVTQVSARRGRKPKQIIESAQPYKKQNFCFYALYNITHKIKLFIDPRDR